MKKITLILAMLLLFLPAVYAAERQTDIVNAIKIIENTLVNIRTEKIVKKSVSPFDNDPMFDDFFGFTRAYKTQSLGSGVLIDPRGIIVTNHHVIEGASKIYVLMSDDTTYEAEIIGSDKILDIAIIKIINSDRRFPMAKLGDSDDLMLGETVIAIGNPYGLHSSVTTGVVSAINRIIKVENGYSVFIQTDALINPGNSGGPLININGDVIGINTMIYKNAQGIGFSIPVDAVKRVMPEILIHKKIRPSYIGFSVTERETPTGSVLIVKSVDETSITSGTGISVGDEILTVAGIHVTNKNALLSVLRSYPPGSKVDLTIKRDEKAYRIKASMNEYPPNSGLLLLQTKIGVILKNINGKIVIIDSKQQKLMQKGEIIIAFNDMELNTIQQLDRLVIDHYDEGFILQIAGSKGVYKIKITQ